MPRPRMEVVKREIVRATQLFLLYRGTPPVQQEQSRCPNGPVSGPVAIQAEPCEENELTANGKC